MPLERRMPEEANARGNALDRLTSGRYPERYSHESEAQSQNTGPVPDGGLARHAVEEHPPACLPPPQDVSSRPLDVTLQVLDSVGRPQGGAQTERALPPQHMANSGVGLVILHDRFATCEVTSQAGTRGDLLVTLCSTDILKNDACVVAVTAQ